MCGVTCAFSGVHYVVLVSLLNEFEFMNKKLIRCLHLGYYKLFS